MSLNVSIIITNGEDPETAITVLRYEQTVESFDPRNLIDALNAPPPRRRIRRKLAAPNEPQTALPIL